MQHSTDLQTKLDNITTRTRGLVQPDRLAITDAAVQELFATGIEDRILPIGATAPTFDLPDAAATALNSPVALNGKIIHSSDLLGIGPLIVTFFRGRWCPYCMTELLVAISPQLARQNDFTVQHHNLTFPLLSDAGSRLADAFRIAYTVPEHLRLHYRSILVNIPYINGDDTWRLPLPATFVISQSGKIIFAEAHADHRVRPDPQDVLATL
jgi:peroxiredoxin